MSDREKTLFLLAVGGLGGLLYGIDFGVIAVSMPYIKALKIYTDAINEDTAIRREEFKTNRYILQGSKKGGSGTEKEELVFRPLASSMKEMKDNVTILSKKLEEMKVGSDDYVDILRDLTYWQKKVKDQQTRDSDFSNFYSGKGYGQGIRVSPDTKIKALTPEEAQKMEKVKVPSARNANAKADDKEQRSSRYWKQLRRYSRLFRS